MCTHPDDVPMTRATLASAERARPSGCVIVPLRWAERG